jgi:hypothetical protein
MATDKKEKKEVLGTNINISSIVKKAEQKREAKVISNTPMVSSKTMMHKTIITKELWEDFRDLYYKLIKELGADFVYLSRGEAYIHLMNFMEKSLDIDISNHKDLYDNYIGTKGRRFINERTFPKEAEKMNYTWTEFTPEQFETFKKLMTKLAVRVGVEKKSDFSKQYFVVDIIDFFRDNIVELAEYIKNAKNGQ